MTHKSSHVLNALLEMPELTVEERAGLMVLAAKVEQHGKLTSSERLALAWLVYKLAKD